ncbi:MAG TPA: hypothetical protein VKV20_20075 [Ktedonobacteraceae bacterium]|jgi:hypothetical protein|nr:hypothetical protein [Ktedonobacteraceae bacterium]
MKSSSPFQQSSAAYDSSANRVYERSAQTMPPAWQTGRARPRRIDVFLHGFKTFKLIGSLLADRRVALWRKAFFFGAIIGLLVILLFPDLINEFVLTTILPLVGTAFGLPLDAGIDWVGFALVVVSLLRFFPADLVAEHYRQVFTR